jgi:hypothetical protein
VGLRDGEDDGNPEGKWYQAAKTTRGARTKREYKLKWLWTPERWEEPKAALAVHFTSSGGSTPMWKSVFDEAREIVWLASIVGGLSAVGVGIAIALVAS